jgi:16S rRNA (guanine527-N7)-methyltransferase
MAVSAVGLGGQVRVVRGRAEDRPVRETVGDAAWCTARAVAPLEKLVAWCLPLLRSGGTLLAMKGERAARETQDARTLLRRLGADVSVTSVGADVLAEPVTVVVVNKREQR